MEITKEELEFIEGCLDSLFKWTNKEVYSYNKELGLDMNETLADILGVILDAKED